MPSGSYWQQAVTCPFYKYDDGKKKIVCEGFRDENLVDVRWSVRQDFERHMELFCCRNCENCEIYRMIYEAKYDDEISQYPDDG